MNTTNHIRLSDGDRRELNRMAETGRKSESL